MKIDEIAEMKKTISIIVQPAGVGTICISPLDLVGNKRQNPAEVHHSEQHAHRRNRHDFGR